MISSDIVLLANTDAKTEEIEIICLPEAIIYPATLFM